MKPQFIKSGGCLLIATLLFCLPLSALATDTDIYQTNVKQNAYILLDNSSSMGFGVYESNIDYGAMYDDLYNKADIGDTIMGGSGWYGNHEEKTKIYLMKGLIGATIINIGGTDHVFTGDAADPDYLWYAGNIVDTHTMIDSLGNLSGDGIGTQRVTVDGDGHILLDGVRLPLGQDILQQDYQTLYDGSLINNGFGGLLNAPGYYFSGFKAVGTSAADHVQVASGDSETFFFITGNWINMQEMYNLHYTSNPGSFASIGDPAWKYETYTISSGSWAVTQYSLDYPSGSGNYTKNKSENTTAQTITLPGASQIQIHFSMFDVYGDGNSSSYNDDYVALYDANNNLIAKYDNDDPPAGGWSPVISGDTVHIKLRSNNNNNLGAGYTIDQYKTTYNNGTYLMQDRMDVAKDAMLYVVDAFRGKINWGFGTFAYTGGGSGNGASFGPYLNPTENDDTNRAAIVTQLNNTDAATNAGTPLGEALQDLFEQGYYGKRNSLDNLTCRRNYAIVVSDGYPSDDDDWSRISGVSAFTDSDGDGFTEDPYQYASPPDDYYDDVAHWIYTHSWHDKTLISDPATSYQNIIPHQIAFGAKQPLMEDAADESGAEYITAYNKTQLVNAFYSLGLMISEAVSFTAPVVSVDEANKVQNGDDLYMGQFLPQDASYWPGNIKHFKLGDGTTDRPDIWKIYDAANNEATDSSGRLVDNLVGFWGDSNDANDHDNYGGPDIQEDGVGEVLTERVQADYLAGSSNYYERNIKTYDGTSLVDFDRTNVSPADLGLVSTDTATRDKTVNWVYGYTFDADATGGPVGPRDWALGAIVHSRPTVIDYYQSGHLDVLEKRYIAVGSDDGMLHVFENDGTGTTLWNRAGTEVFAFVPDDVLTKLPNFETEYHQSLVDGPVKLFRRAGQPKYLFFGLRRGGGTYWRIDISDSDPSTWTVAKFTDGEIGQSWSDIEFAKIRTADNTFADVAVFTGGYDNTEDSFPEPFDDLDNNGTPYANNGNIDNQEWRASDGTQDVLDNDQYDIANPGSDSLGRGIYVVDVDSLSVRFSVTYGAADSPTKGAFATTANQTRTDFSYCFPASPSVVTQSESYSYTSGGSTVYARKDKVLAAIYASDIYGNLFRVSYDYDGGKKWQTKHVFSVAPPSLNGPGELRQTTGTNTEPTGLKVFYGPAVSWLGSGRYFDPGNYSFTGATFTGQDHIASLFFGTGDREHPSYKLVSNRIFAVYDDSPVSATIGGSAVAVSSAPYNEEDLLNLTCDDLGVNTMFGTASQTASHKLALQTQLFDDVTNHSQPGKMELQSGGGGENDAKGWYIILDKQGDPSYCSAYTYVATVDSNVGGRDYHVGEKVLSKLTLFSDNLYFTTYQPSIEDPCAPQGNAFNYALNYLNGAAALNLNTANDTGTGTNPTMKDVTDRYGKHSNIKGIPSSFEVVIRKGDAGAMSSIGGSIVGGGEEGYKIPHKSSGIDLNYWLEQ